MLPTRQLLGFILIRIKYCKMVHQTWLKTENTHAIPNWMTVLRKKIYNFFFFFVHALCKSRCKHISYAKLFCNFCGVDITEKVLIENNLELAVYGCAIHSRTGNSPLNSFLLWRINYNGFWCKTHGTIYCRCHWNALWTNFLADTLLFSN